MCLTKEVAVTDKNNKTLAYYRICLPLFIMNPYCFIVQAPGESGKKESVAYTGLKRIVKIVN